ncbi:MAG: FAD-binding oxidoreductase [Pseudomonadota bacterium]
MTRAAQGLLNAPDQSPGAYPASWYAATANPAPPYPTADGDLTADVCIVGGGFTGLSAALELANAGRRVILLEAHRVGWGASGRNGGQLGSGLNPSQISLEKRLGRDDARHIWSITQAAKRLAHERIATHEIDCDLQPGVAHVTYAPRHEAGSDSSWPGRAETVANIEHLAERYDYDKLELLDTAAVRAHIASPSYVGGALDHGASHLHPLNYALGLAHAACAAGARIFEQSAVSHHAPPEKNTPQATLKTDRSTIRADHVILACNGYLDGLEPRIARRVMPINNFIVATEPLGAERARALIRDNIGVADSNFVVNYFRLSQDHRLLFGGGETYSYRFPKDIAALVRKPVARIFPQLADVRLDYAWGGTLAITSSRLPLVRRLGPSVWSASGFSGHGVAIAPMAGKLIADAITGETDGFNVFARLPTLPFPGGKSLRHPLLVLAMTWYALRDRLGV